jgi:hypothetical protein
LNSSNQINFLGRVSGYDHVWMDGCMLDERTLI